MSTSTRTCCKNCHRSKHPPRSLCTLYTHVLSSYFLIASDLSKHAPPFLLLMQQNLLVDRMKLTAALVFLSLGAASASRVGGSRHRQLQDDVIAMPDEELVADSAGNGGGRSNVGGKPGDFAGYVINKNDPRRDELSKCSYQFAPFDVYDPEISSTPTMECSVPDICNFPGIVADKTTIIGVNMIEMPNGNLKMTVQINCYFGATKALPIFICPSGYKAVSLTQVTGTCSRRLEEDNSVSDEIDPDMACANLCETDINKSIDQTCGPDRGVEPNEKYEFKCKPQNADDL